MPRQESGLTDMTKQPEKLKETIKIGKREFTLPGTKAGRITVGIVLIIGGILGFLPILGFWMIPLGLFILSKDLHLVRRFNRRIGLWWARRKNKRK